MNISLGILVMQLWFSFSKYLYDQCLDFRSIAWFFSCLKSIYLGNKKHPLPWVWRSTDNSTVNQIDHILIISHTNII